MASSQVPSTSTLAVANGMKEGEREEKHPNRTLELLHGANTSGESEAIALYALGQSPPKDATAVVSLARCLVAVAQNKRDIDGRLILGAFWGVARFASTNADRLRTVDAEQAACSGLLQLASGVISGLQTSDFSLLDLVPTVWALSVLCVGQSGSAVVANAKSILQKMEQASAPAVSATCITRSGTRTQALAPQQVCGVAATLNHCLELVGVADHIAQPNIEGDTWQKMVRAQVSSMLDALADHTCGRCTEFSTADIVSLLRALTPHTIQSLRKSKIEEFSSKTGTTVSSIRVWCVVFDEQASLLDRSVVPVGDVVDLLAVSALLASQCAKNKMRLPKEVASSIGKWLASAASQLLHSATSDLPQLQAMRAAVSLGVLVRARGARFDCSLGSQQPEVVYRLLLRFTENEDILSSCTPEALAELVCSVAALGIDLNGPSASMLLPHAIGALERLAGPRIGDMRHAAELLGVLTKQGMAQGRSSLASVPDFRAAAAKIVAVVAASADSLVADRGVSSAVLPDIVFAIAALTEQSSGGLASWSMLGCDASHLFKLAHAAFQHPHTSTEGSASSDHIWPTEMLVDAIWASVRLAQLPRNFTGCGDLHALAMASCAREAVAWATCAIQGDTMAGTMLSRILWAVISSAAGRSRSFVALITLLRSVWDVLGWGDTDTFAAHLKHHVNLDFVVTLLWAFAASGVLQQQGLSSSLRALACCCCREGCRQDLGLGVVLRDTSTWAQLWELFLLAGPSLSPDWPVSCLDQGRSCWATDLRRSGLSEEQDGEEAQHLLLGDVLKTLGVPHKLVAEVAVSLRGRGITTSAELLCEATTPNAGRWVVEVVADEYPAAAEPVVKVARDVRSGIVGRWQIKRLILADAGISVVEVPGSLLCSKNMAKVQRDLEAILRSEGVLRTEVHAKSSAFVGASVAFAHSVGTGSVVAPPRAVSSNDLPAQVQSGSTVASAGAGGEEDEERTDLDLVISGESVVSRTRMEEAQARAELLARQRMEEAQRRAVPQASVEHRSGEVQTVAELATTATAASTAPALVAAIGSAEDVSSYESSIYSGSEEEERPNAMDDAEDEEEEEEKHGSDKEDEEQAKSEVDATSIVQEQQKPLQPPPGNWCVFSHRPTPPSSPPSAGQQAHVKTMVELFEGRKRRRLDASMTLQQLFGAQSTFEISDCVFANQLLKTSKLGERPLLRVSFAKSSRS